MDWGRNSARNYSLKSRREPDQERNREPGAASWMRFFLFGDPNATARLSDAQAAPYVRWERRRLLKLRPCLADLTDEEAEIFEEALGGYAVVRLLSGPQGRDFAGGLIETKIGPVTERSQGLSLAEAITEMGRMAADILRLITCVGIAAGRGTTFARSGRSVAYPPPRTVIEQAFGYDALRGGNAE